MRPARKFHKIFIILHQDMHTMCNPPARRRLCSRLDEKRDSYEANDHQGGTGDHHVPNMISRGARSQGYLVVFRDNRTFVWTHGKLLPWAQHNPLLEASGRLSFVPTHDHLGAQFVLFPPRQFNRCAREPSKSNSNRIDGSLWVLSN